jgi:hypothetical protein
MSNQRITRKDLDNVVSRLNHIAGTPQQPYIKNEETGKYEPQANCYLLGGAYGGWRLEQMSSTQGCTGIRVPIPMGYESKRDCYNAIQAYISGIIDQQESK